MTRIVSSMDHEAVEPTPRRQVSKTERLTILLDQNGRCAKCLEKRALADLDLDHVIPIELGGAHERSNWQLICRDVCHREKTAVDIRNIRKAARLRAKQKPRAEWPKTQKIGGRGFRNRWDSA